MASIEASTASAASATAADDVRVSVLETVLWKRLAEANDLRELAAPWIELQCGLIGAERGLVALTRDGVNPQALASWPAGTSQVALLAAAAAAAEQRRGVVQQSLASGATDATGVLLSYPILQDDRASNPPVSFGPGR